MDGLNERIAAVLDGLNTAEAETHARKGYTFPPDKWHAVERKKFIALDCGTRGCTT